VPGYLEAVDALKALGIDEVIIFCVNDGAVMQAWARDQGVEGSDLLTMMGDPSGTVTSALGMTLTHPVPMKSLGYARCKRFALYLEDGTVRLCRISERGPMGEDDPAGDKYPEETLATAMTKAIRHLRPRSLQSDRRREATATSTKKCG